MRNWTIPHDSQPAAKPHPPPSQPPINTKTPLLHKDPSATPSPGHPPKIPARIDLRRQAPGLSTWPGVYVSVCERLRVRTSCVRSNQPSGYGRSLARSFVRYSSRRSFRLRMRGRVLFGTKRATAAAQSSRRRATRVPLPLARPLWVLGCVCGCACVGAGLTYTDITCPNPGTTIQIIMGSWEYETRERTLSTYNRGCECDSSEERGFEGGCDKQSVNAG